MHRTMHRVGITNHAPSTLTNHAPMTRPVDAIPLDASGRHVPSDRCMCEACLIFDAAFDARRAQPTDATRHALRLAAVDLDVAHGLLPYTDRECPVCHETWCLCGTSAHPKKRPVVKHTPRRKPIPAALRDAR